MKKTIGFASIAIMFLLSGCGTVQNTAYERTGSVSATPMLAQPQPTETYRYGRFAVHVREGGQQIIGGEFIPLESLPKRVTPGNQHAIFINYQTKELLYYRKDSAGYFVPVIGYAVVTPDPSSLPQDEVRGQVTRIDMTPTWCPTENIRRAWPHLPAGCLPFGHSQNAMGAVKFEIAWNVRGWQYHRLHGTAGYPRGSFWTEETFGCTRLVDQAILHLVQLLGGNSAVSSGIEVIVHRTPSDLSAPVSVSL